MDVLLAYLVCQLGADRWQDRDRCHKALARLAPIAASHLERGTKSPDAEIAHRSWQLYLPEWIRRCEAQAMGFCSTMPWLYLSDSYELWWWLELADMRGAEKGGPDFPNYRLATTLWAARQLRDGRSAFDIQLDLCQMARQESLWRAMHER
jgi:hypothetical protein